MCLLSRLMIFCRFIWNCCIFVFICIFFLLILFVEFSKNVGF